QTYNNNCTPECIIPIKFSGINQNISLSDIKLDYEVLGIVKSENKIYEVVKNEPLISSKFLNIDFSKLGILVPNEPGIKNLELNLGNTKLLTKNIEISPNFENKIIEIVPNNPPALFGVTYMAITDKTYQNATYIWNFGDSSPEIITNSNIVRHKFESPGTYELKLKLIINGTEYSKTQSIVTGNARDYIDRIIKEKKQDLSSIEAKINNFPEWIKKYLFEKLEIDNSKKMINSLESRYKEAISDSEYDSIISELSKLNIPYNFEVSQEISPIEIFPYEEQINLEALKSMDNFVYEGEIKDFYDAVNFWILNNLKIILESKTYSFYFRDEINQIPLFSHSKITLIPEGEIDKIYFLINQDVSKTLIKSEDKFENFEDKTLGFIFNNFNSKKEFEFLSPGRLDYLNPPVFISPKFSDLNIKNKIEILCNNDGICDKTLGENYKNCSNDCKPVFLTFTFLLVLFIIAFS
ncbi:TPA: PKD domain-containing protein, partial [bacterium]|nr:PKD domain-containing protein [bacterium]